MYHYAANNPVRYTDPDGREVGFINFFKKVFKKFTSNETTLLFNMADLGRCGGVSSTRSLYNSQFSTIGDQNNGWSTFLNYASFFPGPIGFLGMLGTLCTSDDSNSEIIVNYQSRKAFITGAKKEIMRIDNILNSLTEFEKLEFNGRRRTYEDFLLKQRTMLENEIVINQDYDNKENISIRCNMYEHGFSYNDNRSEEAGSYVKEVDYYGIFKTERLDE